MFFVMKKLQFNSESSDLRRFASAPGRTSRRNALDVRNRPDRFGAAQNVSVRIRKERVGVEEIRAAEHVEHRPVVLIGTTEKGRRPRADFHQLSLLELCPRTVELSGVRSPNGIVRVICERSFIKRHAREKSRRRVGRRIDREARVRQEQIKQKERGRLSLPDVASESGHPERTRGTSRMRIEPSRDVSLRST